MSELNSLTDNTAIGVYDVEKKELIRVYKTAKKAHQDLGITDKLLTKSYTKRIRVHSPVIGKEIACRMIKLTPDMVFHKNVLTNLSELKK